MEIGIPTSCLLCWIDIDGEAAAARRAGPLAGLGALLNEDSGSHDLAAAVSARLAERQFAIVDATALSHHERTELTRIAREAYSEAIAIVATGAEHAGPDGAARAEHRLRGDGFRRVHVVPSAALGELSLRPRRLAEDRRDLTGPFDIIGDVHGCAMELTELLGRLGYGVHLEGAGETRRAVTTAPAGRTVVFVGDLVDRGPATPDVLRIAMAMAAAGHGHTVVGNHDDKCARWLAGRRVKVTHGLETTAAQLSAEPAGFRAEVRAFIEGLPLHLWLASGSLCVTHAGIEPAMLGRRSGEVREFCLYGDTDGERDEHGLSVRYHWAARYRGEAEIVYGHTPVEEAHWFGRTLCIDTGCCFGNRLTALRWPEREIVSVAAGGTYSKLRRPFGHPPEREQARGRQ